MITIKSIINDSGCDIDINLPFQRKYYDDEDGIIVVPSITSVQVEQAIKEFEKLYEILKNVEENHYEDHRYFNEKIQSYVNCVGKVELEEVIK